MRTGIMAIAAFTACSIISANAAPACKPVTDSVIFEDHKDRDKLAICAGLHGVMWQGTWDSTQGKFLRCVGLTPSKKHPGYNEAPNAACLCKDGSLAKTDVGCS